MNWLFKIAFGKAIKKLVQLVVAWAAANQLTDYGIELNVEGLTAGVFALLELLRNYLKVKLGWKIL